jgi:hypothetical protein
VCSAAGAKIYFRAFGHDRNPQASRPASHRRLANAEDASKMKQLPQCVPWPKNPPSVWCGFLLLTTGLNTPDLILQGCSAPDRRRWKSLISILFGGTPGGILRERWSSFGMFMRESDARVCEVGDDFSACSCLNTFVKRTLSSSFNLIPELIACTFIDPHSSIAF